MAVASVDSLDPSLLASGKRGPNAPKGDEPVKVKRPIRAILKLIAYILIFLFSLLFFIVLKLPSSIVSNFILGKINETSPISVEAKNIGISFWGIPHLSVEGLTVLTNPSPFTLNKVEIYPGYLHLLTMLRTPGSIYGSAVVEAFDTKISSSVSLSDSLGFLLSTEKLSLAKVPFLLESNLGLSGMLEAGNLDVNLENKKLSRADGTFNFTAKGLRFDPASVQSYMPLPILDLGSASIQGKVQKGVLRFDKFQIGNSLKDIEAIIDGEIRLNDNWEYSNYTLKIRFKIADKILKAVPSLSGLLPVFAAKKADGYYATKASGTFNAPNPATPDL